ncbi:hypothetical protein BBB56_05485 [Candidatus Pantoea deserta]|uniref:Uncharacterized protein n=1 Tax=Candidatus Pantoea deserta TaxID=1869313 RepID=A0A3N4P957_9GAMM|nr:hypothetical protein BBB56_05485 [Pantoea deserta]
MFKSFLSILFTEILFPVWIFASACFFLYLFPDHWIIFTFISIVAFIIFHPILFGRFDKYD